MNWVLILILSTGTSVDVKSYKFERQCNPDMSELSKVMARIDSKVVVRCEFRY